MARQNHGPLSRAKGKLGGVVYQQYEGMQISREYQPNVKNPQSESQVKNRSAFKLSSQVVGVFKELINVRLAKFSIYTRTRRGAAVAAIKRATTVSGSEGATVNFADVANAINAKSLTEFSAPTIDVAQGNVTVSAPADSTILAIMAGFSSRGEYVGRKVVSGAGTGSPVNFAIPSDFEVTKAMALYTLPQTEEGRASFDNITDPAVVLNVDVERLINSGDIAVSDIAAIAG